eukprot:1704206-Amphidinium_carterae.1
MPVAAPAVVGKRDILLGLMKVNSHKTHEPLKKPLLLWLHVRPLYRIYRRSRQDEIRNTDRGCWSKKRGWRKCAAAAHHPGWTNGKASKKTELFFIPSTSHDAKDKPNLRLDWPETKKR